MDKETILEKAQKQADEREIEIMKASYRWQLVTTLIVVVIYEILLMVTMAFDDPLTFGAPVLMPALNLLVTSGLGAGAAYRYGHFKRKNDLVIAICGVVVVVFSILSVVSYMMGW